MLLCFFWSFIANFITFFVIAKGFSPRNYGLLLLFIVSNPIYIGFQGFLIRQYFATLIFLIAIVNIDRKPLMWGLYILSLSAHIANLIYLPMLLLYNKIRIFGNKKLTISIIALGSILPFSNTLVVDVSQRIAALIPGQYSAIITGKAAFYAQERVNEAGFLFPIAEHLIVFILIFVLIRISQAKTELEKFIYFTYPILYLLMFLGKDISMFSNRVAFLLFPFGGLFYYLAIEHQWKIFKKSILIFVLTLKIAHFNYNLYSISMGESEFHYLNDRVYESTIIDYIELTVDNFMEDVKIKNMPNRSVG